MVDGVVDIPLPGRPLDSGGEEGGAAAACHFLAGPENRLIEVAVRSITGQADISYNPLVLYGPSGSGKSHIAQGLATEWKARNRRDRVVSTTAVDFARELAEAIESQAVEEFRVKHRTANLLVVEDLGMLVTGKSGKLRRSGRVYSHAGCDVGRGRVGGGDGFGGTGRAAGTITGPAKPAGGWFDDSLGPARSGRSAGRAPAVGRFAEGAVARTGGPGACRRAYRHRAGVGRGPDSFGHGGSTWQRGDRSSQRSPLSGPPESPTAAEPARDRLGHGAAFFRCDLPTCAVQCGGGPW